jgi:hypothetical protein
MYSLQCFPVVKRMSKSQTMLDSHQGSSIANGQRVEDGDAKTERGNRKFVRWLSLSFFSPKFDMLLILRCYVSRRVVGDGRPNQHPKSHVT